ncbi:hypothetical protein OF83DRAFT_1089465 [Amylostereum chailletii]|nr:hypothetical protein OF83DRAFT_1089465 [Amylostereum chailletii]
MSEKLRTVLLQRTALLQSLGSLAPLGLGAPIGALDANFLMIPVLERVGSEKPDNARAQKVYKTLAEEEGVVVRYRGGEMGCEGCLRITVGTEEENKVVVEKMRKVLEVL